MEACYAPVNLGNQIVQPLTYNGQVPAPRLEVQPGDTIRIHLTNDFNWPTNIHYHGFHINDFQVVSRDDRAASYPAWKDTVSKPVKLCTIAISLTMKNWG